MTNSNKKTPLRDIQETSIQLIWFSLTREYFLLGHTFNEEDLPLRIPFKGEGWIEISQEFIGYAFVLRLRTTIQTKVGERRYNQFKEMQLEEGTEAIMSISELARYPKIKAEVSVVLPRLEDITEKLFKLLRWRFKLAVYLNKSTNGEFKWSFDQHKWQQINSFKESGVVCSPFYFIQNPKEEIEKLITTHSIEEETEPIGHTILREAQTIISSSPESGLVMGFVALEVAVKRFITLRDPEYIFPDPSPNIHKLLTEIIPALDTKFELSNKDQNTVKDIMLHRNDMVHKGKMPDSVGPHKITKYLAFIEMIILMLDVHMGFDWAQEYLNFCGNNLRSMESVKE
ncbi:hypothetical protein [Chitinophaga arvensicola]|uniref:Apea-like HEPN domain-containing protein n=1 Tax=Chitinophaga arvensicola TaxID=29529 RepID=A0A1I0S552_9BACT|nr:hypothetical protein [Chitinophaga arvensicola]SEW49948.1 hypothetical protein SAMN04488122_3645 [Chitinophaga arvensicola]